MDTLWMIVGVYFVLVLAAIIVARRRREVAHPLWLILGLISILIGGALIGIGIYLALVPWCLVAAPFLAFGGYHVIMNWN
jgi:hypothetical protein